MIFIPLALMDFDDDALIRRFQEALLRGALTAEIRSAIRNLDVIEIQPEEKSVFTGIGVPLDRFWRDVVFTKPVPVATPPGPQPATMEPEASEPETEPLTLAGVKSAMAEVLAQAPAAAAFTGSRPLQLSAAISAVAQVNDRLWLSEQTTMLSRLLDQMVLRRDSNAVFLPTDVWIEGTTVVADGVSLTVNLHTRAGSTIRSVSATNPVAMSQLTRIGLTGNNSGGTVSATVVLTLNRNGVRFPLELPAVTIAKGFTGETKVVKINPGGINTNLKQHLRNNRLHYSQAVFRSLDSAQIALLLSGCRAEVGGVKVPVAQLVEPRPLRYVGNYLAFKMSASPNDDEWAKWLTDRGITVGDSEVEVVPLASGGTFAEAVLGRANSAEKLDITRFWHWQDSPIPLQPTEIAAIQTGSRAIDENVAPGQLSSPIVNLMAPSGLPDSAGLAAVLAAIQNGAMFWDMSGLQATIGLAQAALQATAAGASTAGQQAGTNMQNHLQAQTERMRIAADLAKSAIAAYAGVPEANGKGGSASSHSQDGAKVNYFDKTVGQGEGGASGSGAIDGAAIGTVAGDSGGGTAYSKNPGILSATWGDTESPSNMIDKLVGTITGDGAEEPSAVAAGNATTAWPKLDRVAVVDRLNVLRGNPNEFQQGKVGLCTAAALFHHVLQKEPAKFMQFANAIHGSGVGYLGQLKVRPGHDLRHADYAALAARFPPFPPQADWMCMCSLRDSENWFFDFEGSPDDDDIETSAKELASWYEDTGFYSSVRFDTETTVAKIKAISKTANNHVALWIATKLIEPGRGGAHMITVESPIVIDEAADSVTFDFWTWGQPPRTLSTTFTAMNDSYYGVIEATF